MSADVISCILHIVDVWVNILSTCAGVLMGSNYRRGYNYNNSEDLLNSTYQQFQQENRMTPVWQNFDVEYVEFINKLLKYGYY